MIFSADNAHIKQSYLVCSTGRSGSTLLCKTLKQLEAYGRPEEYFHHVGERGLHLKDDLNEFCRYFNAILQEGTTSNGVFGIKMHWWQLHSFLKITRQFDCFAQLTDLEILQSLLPNLKFIYIWRQDMIAQAVSTTIALQTRVWEKIANNTQHEDFASSNNNSDCSKSFETEESKRKTLKFKPLKIYRWEQSFRDQNRRWKHFLTENQLNYHELTYERLTSNSFEKEIKSVLDFLAVHDSQGTKPISMATKKQSNNVNQRFIQRYCLFPPISLKICYKLQRWQQNWS